MPKKTVKSMVKTFPHYKPKLGHSWVTHEGNYITSLNLDIELSNQEPESITTSAFVIELSHT